MPITISPHNHTNIAITGKDGQANLLVEFALTGIFFVAALLAENFSVTSEVVVNSATGTIDPLFGFAQAEFDAGIS